MRELNERSVMEYLVIISRRGSYRFDHDPLNLLITGSRLSIPGELWPEYFDCSCMLASSSRWHGWIDVYFGHFNPLFNFFDHCLSNAEADAAIICYKIRLAAKIPSSISLLLLNSHAVKHRIQLLRTNVQFLKQQNEKKKKKIKAVRRPIISGSLLCKSMPWPLHPHLLWREPIPTEQNPHSHQAALQQPP